MPKRASFLTRLCLARWAGPQLGWIGVPLLVATIALGWLGPPWCWAAALPAVALALLVWFFRDPPRQVTHTPNGLLAPADGKIVAITPIDHYDFFDGPAVSIGIFLSIFNAHVNRSPADATVLETDYRPGAYLDARDPESARRNEYQWIGFADHEGRRFAVRQVSGAVARRIVCELTPGATVRAGDKFGMIKFGSRTELIVPLGCPIACQIGDRVRAGIKVLAYLNVDG
ncbi:MAG: phosphatidylserine decarboxylase [Planctomycetota bacterium]